MENTYKNKPISSDLVLSTRSDVDELANELRDHIRSTGSQAHVDATLSNPGFMTPEQLSNLLGIQDAIDDLKNVIDSTGVPDNVILYWWRDDLPIPDGYVLCDGNNNTIDIRDKYIRSINTDSDYRDVEGSNVIDLSKLPVPRHRHSFKNYFYSEISSELNSYKSSNPNYKVQYYDNKPGSNGEGSVTDYPLYFTDYTDTYSQSNTNSTYEITNEPPHYVLKSIMRQRTEYPVVEYGIGSLILCLANSVPEGFIELSGNTIDLDLYSSVKDYVLSNGLGTTEAEYSSTLATYGSVLKFVIDEDLRTIKVPTLRTLLGVSSFLSPYTIKKSVNLHHYHGLGTYDNNNGTWGRYSYTNAVYPEGSTGWFWNGSGGSGTASTPDLSGDTIVSYEQNIVSMGTGELTSNVSLVVAMCISHTSTSTTLLNNPIISEISSINEYLTEYEATPTATYNTIKDVNGRTKLYGVINYDVGTNTELRVPEDTSSILFVKAWDTVSYVPISIKSISANSVLLNTENNGSTTSNIAYEIWVV